MKLTRRETLKAMGAMGGFAALTLFPRSGSATPAPAGDARLVVVILRGGLDGLAAVPAYGDPEYERARAGIALPPPGQDGGAIDLDGFFGLHPRLEHVAARHAAGELCVVHATCTPYRRRSHFDAQNVLENGSPVPYGRSDGWLNRALAARGTAGTEGGVALSTTMPVILQGAAPVTSWSPARLPEPSLATVERVARLYEQDAQLADAFAKARETNDALGDLGGRGLEPLVEAAARLLRAPDGPRVAVLEAGGFDTHANQGIDRGSLDRNLRQLDAGIGALHAGLGDAWAHTAVAIVTEFGRTVAMNGTRGTDHGTGGVALVVGGAVADGRVIANWPGLRKRDLYEGRDLRPTTDLRALWKGLLVDHLGVPAERVDQTVFPEAKDVAAIPGLVRPAMVPL